MAIVALRAVEKIYPLGNTKVQALKDVSFELQKGDFVSIVGPSGSGKSTILNLIGCIDTPSSGTVSIDGADVGAWNDKQRTALRQQALGFIFQSFNLIPVLDVYENIEFPLLLGAKRVEKRAAAEWIDFLIGAVGLQDHRRHKPAELSGGQRQRVAIARALVTKPRIVLADEPTANLDSKTGQAIVELMRKMNAELGTTFVFSTHDTEIVGIADHVIRLLDGRVVEDARTAAGRAKAANA